MFDEYIYKTELHLHTSPASKCSDVPPELAVELYHEMGYKTIVLTNHFVASEEESNEKIKNYLNDYHKAKELGKELGLEVVLGAEIRFSENINDYLLYGISDDDLLKVNSLLGLGVDNFYKEFINDKNILLQAHPFRDNMTPVNPESIDGIEAFNMHPGHNARIGRAAKYAREHDFIITCGSDCHHVTQEGMCGILTKEPVTDSCQLAKILRSRDYVIDISGYKLLPY